MGARTGAQFLQGLRSTKRQLWLDGERVDDVTAHPALAGGARTLAGRVRPPPRLPPRVPRPRPGDGRAAQHRPHDPALGRRPEAAQPRADANRGGHGRPHGADARLYEREVRELRRALARLDRRGRPERGGRPQHPPLPEAAGARGHRAHPHDHPPHRRQVDRRPDPRQPGAAPQGRRDGGRDRRARRPHPRDARAVRRRDRRLSGASAARRGRGVRARVLHPRRHAGADLPLPGQRFHAGGHVFDRPLSTRFDEQDAFVIFDDVRGAARSALPRRPRGRVQHGDHHGPARQPHQPDDDPGADQARIRLRPGYPHGGSHRRRQRRHPGDAGRALRLHGGHAERRAAVRRARPARWATARGSPTDGRSPPCAPSWPRGSRGSTRS